MEKSKKKKYRKPTVLAVTKQSNNFSAVCKGGNCNCLHCRQF